MHATRVWLAAVATVGCALTWGAALSQGRPDDPLAVGRQMLAEDNPGELWIDRGKELFYEKRGPKNASLEQCDFGLGPGKLERATTQLPRYFPDTDKVQDLESRLLTCMVQLQGFKRDDVVKRAISPGGSSGSDVEALALSPEGNRRRGPGSDTRRATGRRGASPICHRRPPGR